MNENIKDEFIVVHANARVAERLPDGTLLVWLWSEDYPHDFYDRSRPVRVFPFQVQPREPQT